MVQDIEDGAARRPLCLAREESSEWKSTYQSKKKKASRGVDLEKTEEKCLVIQKSHS